MPSLKKPAEKDQLQRLNSFKARELIEIDGLILGKQKASSEGSVKG